MIKKIKTEDLRTGMFIQRLNSSWWDHPFLSNSFMVKEEKFIEKIIQAGIHEVYIDTQKGLDVPNAPTESEVSKEISAKIEKISTNRPERNKTSALQDELVQANAIQKEARQVVSNIMGNVRRGGQVDLKSVENLVGDMVESIFRNQDALICLSRIKQKDDYTFQHSISVCVLMLSFAKKMKLDRAIIDQIGTGGLLHDLGKMKVPLKILNKAGPLDEEEFQIMKGHVVYGEQILSQTPGVTPLSFRLVSEHHERIDGKGYPLGLLGDAISLVGQMTGIVDVYDALTSNRVYRSAMEPFEALRSLLEWSKYQFKEELVHSFIRTVGIYPVGTLVRLKNDLLGVVVEQGEKSLTHPVVRIIYDARNRAFVMPWKIDLFQNAGQEEKCQIASPESFAKWHIDPHEFL
jgi:putative nucleotidyltransferase with HDIG domain